MANPDSNRQESPESRVNNEPLQKKFYDAAGLKCDPDVLLNNGDIMKRPPGLESNPELSEEQIDRINAALGNWEFEGEGIEEEMKRNPNPTEAYNEVMGRIEGDAKTGIREI